MESLLAPPGQTSRAVHVVECETWDHFVASLRREYAESYESETPLYRGHARSHWKLASPWERELKAGARDRRSSRVSELLATFKDLAIGLPGVRTKDLVTDDDWWTLGRHYGLATPLLDWTRSPYVAAFFAFTGFLDYASPGATFGSHIDAPRLAGELGYERVAIWSLSIERISSSQLGLPEHLEIIQSRTDIGHRQRAQRGVFTRLADEQHTCLEDYLESLQPDVPPLRKYLIPGREVAQAITELRMMNITFGTLFPDLTGAALQANFERLLLGLLTISTFSGETWDAIKRLAEARRDL